MVLGDDYATLAELKAYAGVDQTTFDNLLNDALEAASRGVESVCHRQFNDAGTATARVYKPVHGSLVEVDDFHTITGLVVKTDTAGDGTYATTLTAADYELRPLNGIISGQAGWPFASIWGTSNGLYPTSVNRASVQVTARWGWATVPKPVKQACLMLAEDLYKMKDAAFGIAGMDSYGTVRVRENPAVMRKLAPYVVDPILAVS